VPIVPAGAAIIVILLDSILRRGKTGFLWIICLIIMLRFYIDSPQMNELANNRPAAAAGSITAVCMAGLVLYFVYTFKQRRASICKICGVKLNLLNREFNADGICTKCAKGTQGRTEENKPNQKNQLNK
jgi:hypothetical protein